ncbi:hypothetical protein ES705_14093 [subsurface metagenome]
MNILKGRLNKKEMARFVGVNSREVDKSLAIFKEKGYISYEKIRGKYHFILFGEPVKEMEIRK